MGEWRVPAGSREFPRTVPLHATNAVRLSSRLRSALALLTVTYTESGHQKERAVNCLAAIVVSRVDEAIGVARLDLHRSKRQFPTNPGSDDKTQVEQLGLPFVERRRQVL